MVDIQGAFFFKSGFEEEMLIELEDIGIETAPYMLDEFRKEKEYGQNKK